MKNQWVEEGITRGIRKYFEMNKSDDTMYKIFWYEAKALLRGKFIAVNAYIKE